MAAAAPPEATRAASPPEEPPQVRAGSRGLELRPKTGFSVSPAIESSGTLPRATITAPAALSLRTTAESSAHSRGGIVREPTVTSRPAIPKTSFTLTGSPDRGPGSGPRASDLASSARISAAALIRG